MNVRFTVGEFAKLCGISKQTLIFYDKENVVKPKYKNPDNGYRYYTADQLEQLDSVMVLREMGLTLNEIKEYMQNRSLHNSLQLLEGQKAAIHKKIEALTAVEKRIDQKAESLQLFCRQDASFKIEELPAMKLAVMPVKAPGGLLEVDIALKRLMQKMRSAGTAHFYQVGDIVAKDDLLAGDFIHFKWAFLPVETQDETVQSLTTAPGLYAVQCHFGPYTTMGKTYQAMLKEIAKRGRRVAGDACEFCVLDSLTSATPEKYCTQIQIPIE